MPAGPDHLLLFARLVARYTGSHRGASMLLSKGGEKHPSAGVRQGLAQILALPLSPMSPSLRASFPSLKSSTATGGSARLRRDHEY